MSGNKSGGFGRLSEEDERRWKSLPKAARLIISVSLYVALAWGAYHLFHYGFGLYISHNLENTWMEFQDSIASDLDIEVEKTTQAAPLEIAHKGVQVISKNTGYRLNASEVTLGRQMTPNAGFMVIRGMSLQNEEGVVVSGDLALRWEEIDEGIELRSYSTLKERSSVVSRIRAPALTPEHMDQLAIAVKRRLSGEKPDLEKVRESLVNIGSIMISEAVVAYRNLGAFDQFLEKMIDLFNLLDVFETTYPEDVSFFLIDELKERIKDPEMVEPLERFVLEKDSVEIRVYPSRPVPLKNLLQALAIPNGEVSPGEALKAYGVTFRSPSPVWP